MASRDAPGLPSTFRTSVSPSQLLKVLGAARREGVLARTIHSAYAHISIQCKFHSNEKPAPHASGRSHGPPDDPDRSAQEGALRTAVLAGGSDLLTGRAAHDPDVHRGTTGPTLDARRGRAGRGGHQCFAFRRQAADLLTRVGRSLGLFKDLCVCVLTGKPFLHRGQG